MAKLTKKQKEVASKVEKNKVYNLDELGHQWSYSKYFCIEDCSYENSKNNDSIN